MSLSKALSAVRTLAVGLAIALAVSFLTFSFASTFERSPSIAFSFPFSHAIGCALLNSCNGRLPPPPPGGPEVIVLVVLGDQKVAKEQGIQEVASK